MKSKILVVEDSIEILEVLKLYLSSTDHEIYIAQNGIDALEICKKNEIDLGIFDLMIPGISGHELIKEVRKFSEMPILILSAMVEDHDKILGFSIGADDYITKPFNPVELLARVNVSLRRWDLLKSKNNMPQVLKVGELTLDLNNFVLTKNDVEIQITAIQFKILKTLMNHPGRLFSKIQICEIVHGDYFESDENSVIVHISHIRDKIGLNESGDSYIKTKRGLGYKIEG